MAALPDNSELHRWAALGVLILILVLIYFMVFQSFVTDHGLLNEEMSDLQESRQEHTELAAQIPELQKRINIVKETVGDNTSFLLADTYNLGTAELTRTLKNIVALNTEVTTECQTISNTPSKDRDPDQFEKIIIKVRMRCHFGKMMRVLEDIDQHVPHLFVNNLQLEQRIIRARRNTKAQKPILEVRFDLYAYMNKPVRVKDNDKK